MKTVAQAPVDITYFEEKSEMKKALILSLSLLLVAGFFLSCEKEEAASGPVSLTVWTKEGEADGTLQWSQEKAAEFMAANPDITVEILNKQSVEILREDFQTASLAGDENSMPDLLWTVSDHAGPFVTADLIQPVEDLFPMKKYVESVESNGHTWAVPISAGNHLMLIYNKDYISTPPKNTDEMIEMAQEHTSGENYGLVYNLGEAFWLAPWLGGFKTSVFEDDGVTPNLNTSEMVAALSFVSSLKDEYGIVPNECDYNAADALFKEGKAAMIINGDWSLGAYAEVFGDNFGVAPIPQVSATKAWPQPYTAGVYFMVPKHIEGAKLDAVQKLVEFFMTEEVQTEMVENLKRLPGILSVTPSDPLLADSTEALAKGTPMPTVLEMRAVWDAMNPHLSAVMAGSETPKAAAEAMQREAVQGIEMMK